MREIVRASAWLGFRQLVEDLGGNADEILAAAHVDVAALADPDRYLPLRAFIDSEEIAAERLGRRDFGLLLGTRQSVSVLGPLSIAILNSATARESIETCARYLHLHNPSLTMSLAPVVHSSRDFLDLQLELKRPAKHEQNSERMLASVHKTLRQLIGDGYKPYAVWFTHKQLSPLSAYRKVFGITPVFGRPRMGISMERSLLDTWRPGSSAQLRLIAETFLKQMSPPKGKLFSVRVANVARGLLRGGDATPEQTASALGIHPRTLQRRLQSEDTSFEAVKDGVRRELAEALLSQPNVPLSQIASLLDYADSSAFSRSCRRWYGEPPSAVRRRLTTTATPTPTQRVPRVKSYDLRQLVKSKRA